MKNSDWPKDEILRLAESSGKPLEVACAQTLLAAGWTARLGSYFSDGSSMRELDVLAVKEDQVPPLNGLTCRMRVLVSCRGFPIERSPLAYSVSTNCVPSFQPCLPSNHKGNTPGFTQGPLRNLESAGAKELLRCTSLNAARPLVAFDMLERTERTERKRGNKPKEDEGSKPVVEYKRCGDGDRQLFTAIDSAVKAALDFRDKSVSNPNPFVELNVPVCVLSMPFWDVCIDGGKAASPQIRHYGYQANSYPGQPARSDMTVLIWSSQEFRRLVPVLNNLFGWLRSEIQKQEFSHQFQKRILGR